MTVKVKSDNELLNNMDVSKQQTKLQKEIDQQVKTHKEAQSEEERKQKEAQAASPAAEDDSEQSGSEEEERPTGIVQPKFKVVHSYNHDIMDSWAGHEGTLEQAQLEKSKKRLPESLTVTIFAKHCESMRQARLDINESTLLFEVEGLYYLDLNLKYKVNSEEGSAKFDKTRKTLTIKVPVVGLTEDSQKVMDQHYQEYLQAEDERQEAYKKLELSTLQEDADAARMAKYTPGGAQAAGEDQQKQEAGEEPGEAVFDGASEAVEGVSKKKFLLAVDNDEDAAKTQALEEKYTGSVSKSAS